MLQFHVKLGTFKIKVYILLAKADAFEIKMCIVEIKASVFQFKLDFPRRLGYFLFRVF